MYLLHKNDLNIFIPDNGHNLFDADGLSTNYSTILTCLSAAILFIFTVWQCAKCKKSDEPPERVVEETPAVVQDNETPVTGPGAKAPIFRQRTPSQPSIESKIHAQGLEGSASSLSHPIKKHKRKVKLPKKKQDKAPAVPLVAQEQPTPEEAQENVQEKKVKIVSPQSPIDHSTEEEKVASPPAPSTPPKMAPAPRPRPIAIDNEILASLRSEPPPPPPNVEQAPANDVSQKPSLPSPVDFEMYASLQSDKPKTATPLVTADFYAPDMTKQKTVVQQDKRKKTERPQLNWNSANFRTLIEKPLRKASTTPKSPTKKVEERKNEQSIGFRIYDDKMLYKEGTGQKSPLKTTASQVWRPPPEPGPDHAALHEQLIASGKAVPARQKEYQTLYGLDQEAMHRSKKSKSKMKKHRKDKKR